MSNDLQSEYGPCSCEDSGKCRYVNGGPACMNDEPQAAPASETPEVDELIRKPVPSTFDGSSEEWHVYEFEKLARSLERRLRAAEQRAERARQALLGALGE